MDGCKQLYFGSLLSAPWLCRSLKKLSAFLLCMWVMTPVWADDTEIFFGSATGAGGTLEPNVLFIIDTSGSMGSRPSGSSSGDRKIEIVKDALKQLVTQLTGVNVGLMRFSDPGGPVLFPLTSVDQTVSVGTVTLSYTPTVPGQDEALEELNSGSVVVEPDELQVGGELSDGGGSSGVEKLICRIADGDDDAFEDDDEEVDRGDDLLELRDEDYFIGLRFRNCEVPEGATVQDARIRLTTADRNNRRSRRDLIAEVHGDRPPAREFRERDEDISDRNETGARVDWLMNDSEGDIPGLSERIVSPNLAAIVQEIIEDGDWLDGGSYDNDIVFMLKQNDGGGRRYFKAYEHDDDGDEAELEVSYTLDGGGSSAEAWASGIRFAEVAVPRTADLSAGILRVTPSRTVDGAQEIRISIQSSSAPPPFTESDGDVSGRGSAQAITVSVPRWVRNEPVSIDIQSLLQDHFNDASWCGGSPLALVLTGGSEVLEFYSSDGSDPEPELTVSYDGDSVDESSACLLSTISAAINADADDAEMSYRDNGRGRDLDDGNNRISIDDNDWGLFRFDSVAIPDNAEIVSARLFLTSDSDENDPGALVIDVDPTGNSQPFDSESEVADRSWTGGVTWSIGADSWEAGIEYGSPDISSLVSQVIGRGFGNGDAISFRVTLASGDTRDVVARDDSQTNSARLEIRYRDNGTQTLDSVRSEMTAAIDSLTANGYTPIQDTLFEAYQYYTGGDVLWGRYRGGHNLDGDNVYSGPFEYTRVSHPGSIDPASSWNVVRPPGCTVDNLGSEYCDNANSWGEPRGEYLSGSPRYLSPFSDEECQPESHIVFLTDGAANSPHSETLIRNAIGTSCSSSVNSSQRCVIELARHMYENDLSASKAGNQRVVTHMIGFDYDEPWLEDIAAAGGGLYRTANDLDTLMAEFRAIVDVALEYDTTFVAPVAAINQSNRLTNRDDIYFAVFQPKPTERWPGNLKKYQLGSTNGVSGVILDQNGNPAIDGQTGFFRDTSQSFWSSEIDSYEVILGGAGENLPDWQSGGSGRRVYTNLADWPTNLAASMNSLDTGNRDLTADVLGVPEASVDELIQWIRGRDTEDEDADTETDDMRMAIADPLHSKPVAINYGYLSGDRPDTTLFFGTNSGNLHAISADDGKEVFSFIPRDLLGLQSELKANTTGQHLYGLDGSPGVWTNYGDDADLSDSGDFAYLYIGQRRGGKNYYALDVTDRDAPELMWQINNASAGFEDLGQTWARPIPGRLVIAGEARDVVYLSGGYDVANDTESVRQPDSMGNAIYIVDARTGEKLWSVGASAGHDLIMPDMVHSIPAAPAVFDIDGDGYDDGFFVGDTGGQVWRFDLESAASAADLARGGVIAQLGEGGDASEANNRRFFHSPDVSLAEIGGTNKIAVSIGSGNRPSPLSTAVNDRFYTIFQDSIYGAPNVYETLREGTDPTNSDFYNASLNLLQNGSSSEVLVAQSQISTAKGWYVDFSEMIGGHSGEKVLSTPITFRGVVTFTTYLPNTGAATGACTPKAGTSRVYVMGIEAGQEPDVDEDGLPRRVWTDLAQLNPDDGRYIDLLTPSIVDEPVVICTGDGCNLFTGTEQPPIELLNDGQIKRSYWRQGE